MFMLEIGSSDYISKQTRIIKNFVLSVTSLLAGM